MMNRRLLALALATVLTPLAAQGADLVQVYDMARQGDPQLSAAEAEHRYTREGAVQARAALLPQINGDASLTRSRSELEGVSGRSTSTDRNYRLSGSQVLFDWSSFANKRAQNQIARAADFELESANDDLIMRTAQAYFNVLVAIESYAAAQANEAAARKQFDFADKRLEVGLAPITDVHEARAQFDQARADTILARNALADAQRGLVELTGQPVTDLRGLPDDFRPQMPANRADVEALVTAAITTNPTLQANQLRLGAAEAGISAARAGHLPTLALGASWGRNASWGDSVGSTSRDQDLTTNSIGLTLNVPIFSGGATQSRVRQAIAQRDMAQDGVEQTRRALDRNTRNAWQAVMAGISEVEARRSAVVSAQAAYDASQVGLEVGTRTVLDLVQNQRTLFSAQMALAQARYNFLLNRLALAQAVGDLDMEELADINRLLTVPAESRLASGADTRG